MCKRSGNNNSFVLGLSVRTLHASAHSLQQFVEGGSGPHLAVEEAEVTQLQSDNQDLNACVQTPKSPHGTIVLPAVDRSRVIGVLLSPTPFTQSSPQPSSAVGFETCT